MGSRTLSENVLEVAVASLRPHPRNPRVITPARMEHLKRSLEAERDMLHARPIVALPDGTVIAGNQRLVAARELGWETVPTVYVDLDEERATRWMLLDNRSFGEDDAGLAAELLAELSAAGSDLMLTGYDSGDVDRLLRAFRLRDRDPDDAPPLPEGEPRSKRGEVYQLGPHRLVCGDATDSEVLNVALAGGVADLLLTDPPYGVSYQGGAQAFSPSLGRRRVRSMLGDKSAELYAATLPMLHPLLREDGALYLWFSDSRSAEVLREVASAGFRQRCVIIWAKDVPTGSLVAHYIPRHEPLLYASAGEKVRWFGPTNETTLWEYPKPRTNPLHPTQKPAALIERAIRNSSSAGDVVFDPFAGSGTTMIAAEKTGRVSSLVEIDPAYCDVIRDRYEAFVAD